MTRATNTEIVERVARMEERQANMQEDLKEVKQALKVLPDELIKKLDERYASKQKVQEIEETVAPFTAWRKKVWYLLVTIVVIGAIEIALFADWAKGALK